MQSIWPKTGGRTRLSGFMYNLELLDRYGSEAHPSVFARLSFAEATPQVFAPVLKAA